MNSFVNEKFKKPLKESIPFAPEGLIKNAKRYESMEEFYYQIAQEYPGYIATLMQMYDIKEHRRTSVTRHLTRLMQFIIRRYFAPTMSIPHHGRPRIILNTDELTPIEDPRIRPFSLCPWKNKTIIANGVKNKSNIICKIKIMI